MYPALSSLEQGQYKNVGGNQTKPNQTGLLSASRDNTFQLLLRASVERQAQNRPQEIRAEIRFEKKQLPGNLQLRVPLTKSDLSSALSDK